ncbi:MAG: TatD family hydrolase [Lachnospiraceae bacterium]|nr:TatD family hydrolase [Lachnospiraceae bacterium]
MIFDTHAHYDDEAFDEDREALLNRMQAGGIGRIVNIGANMRTSEMTVELTKRYDFIYGAVGVHPNDVGEMKEEDLQRLCQWAGLERIVAIGEIGLDYHYDEPERAIQFQWFEAQMELARQVQLPIVVHSRDAAKDTIDLMKACHAEEIGGVVHCYSYTKELAREFLNMDYYFGVGGVLTFPNAKKLKEAVAYIPLEKIVLETDCPYLAPVPNRGKRNSSLNLPYVAEVLAEIKGLPVEEIEAVTFENGKRLYRMRE